jgi:hypothetical protein
MKTDNIRKHLNSWGKEFVKKAKKNLVDGKKGGGWLEKSLDFNVEKEPDGYTIELLMAGYGTFQDKGVKGAGGVLGPNSENPGAWGGRRWFINWEGKRQDSPYKYGNNTGPRGGMTRGIRAFIKKKRISTVNTSIVGLQIAIMRTIWIKGIHGIYFFQSALRTKLDDFTTGLADELGEDIIDNLTQHPRIFRAKK